MSKRSGILPGVTIRPLTLGLVVGDLLVILSVMAIGLLSHDVSPLADPSHTIQTALPFLLGWILTAPVCGLYAERIWESIPFTVGITILAWSGASLLGGAIRSTTYFHGGAPAVFIVVTVGTGLLVLLPWRVFISYALSR